MRGLINYHRRNLRKFSDVTKFRLVVLMLILIVLQLLIPSLTQLEGTLLHIESLGIIPATILAGFSIIQLISQKFSKYVLDNTKPSIIFKGYIFMPILWYFSTWLYFLDPVLMVWVYAVIGVIDGFIMFVYQTTISNYMVYFEHEKYTVFQNYRNDILTEVGLIGAVLSFTISYFFGVDGVILFTNLTFGLYLIYYISKNYRLMDAYDFKYMLRYHRSVRKG